MASKATKPANNEGMGIREDRYKGSVYVPETNEPVGWFGL